MGFTYDKIIEIYNTEYINNHIGGTTLSKKYGIDFHYYCNKYNLPLRSNQEKNKKFSCNSNYFEVIDTEEKAYWLGFLYADGYISNPGRNNNIKRVGLSITADDIKHLEKFKEAVSSNVPIHEYTVSGGYKIGTKYCRIIISDNKMAEDLISHGCLIKKTNIIKPPCGIPEFLEKHFIRGFMDGNGSICKSTCRYGYSFAIKFCSTDLVLMWIQEHLIKNNIITHYYPLMKRKSGQVVSSFEFGGNNQVIRYLHYIYSGATVFLDRKYSRYIELDNIISEKNRSDDG